MRALSYLGPGRTAWADVADPEITHDLDAVIRVDTVTICGTDLRILRGDVPAVSAGRILGHTADGTQAEYVRVPFAENSTYPVPRGVTDAELLMLSDILPTGYEVGVRNGGVQPGDVVAVVLRHPSLRPGRVSRGLRRLRPRGRDRRAQGRPQPPLTPPGAGRQGG